MKTKWIVLTLALFAALSLQAQIPEEAQETPAVETAPAAETEIMEITVTPAEPDSPAAEIPVIEVDELGITEEDIATDARILGGRISLTLSGVELQDVIRLFSRLSNANIIVPDLGEEISARRVDINLANVEWKPALQAILDTYGLELYEKIPNTEVYSVREKVADAPEPLDVQTFKLDYANVADVSDMIKGMIPEPGRLSVFPSRNTVVVQSTAQNLSEIQTMIASIDSPREQVFIEAKFLELSDGASEKLGIDWQSLGDYNVTAGPFSRNYGITRTDADTVGGANTGDEIPEVYESPAGDGLFLNTPAGQFSQTLKNETITALLSAGQLDMVLAALKETDGTKVVSNPKIIVANEEQASIHIGAKKPNVKGTTQTAGDSQVITTYALDEIEPYFEDGIRVNVTPTINTSSNITVKIEPTLDRLDVLPFRAPDGTEFYGKTTKTITTLFSLESGQTAAIGGLTRDSADEIERKIPFLGEIPFLGRLFSYSSKIKGQEETVIFVTVGLANPANIRDDVDGLPEDASLTRRYRLTSGTDRAVKAEELRILEQHEQERVRKEVQALRDAQAALSASEEAEQPREPVVMEEEPAPASVSSAGGAWVADDYIKKGRVDTGETGAQLAVRSGPGSNYSLIDRLSNDEPVTVLEKQKGWVRIELESGGGSSRL
jgi:type IV pilus assembly protein PilQ